jgi:uncharacterized membrane-anchored protein YhcB (DUF1043 family)
MKKIISKSFLATLCCIFATLQLSAAMPDSTAFVQLQQQVDKLQAALKNQKSDFSKQVSSANTSIKTLQSEIESQKQTIATLADSLGVKITATEQSAQTHIGNVETRHATSLRGIILGGIALLLLSVALFWWLYRRQKSNRADIIGQLEKTKSSIDEKLVVEFAKNAEVLQTLVGALRATPLPNNATEPDHSLALKLADEITLIERNISLMDTNTKGLKQLNRSIGKLKDNLAANGYEIPELLGKPYNDGMKIIIVNSIYDEKLEKGQEIITKIIKPQVNYKDVMIQAAQIEVSVG